MTVREVSINITLGWIPTRAWQDGWIGPDELVVELSVWKNNELLDKETIEVKSVDEPASINFQKDYTAKP